MTSQNATIKEETPRGVVRPPIVVVLGHVDHGKSSLLEAIREDFRITGKEAGGITQHIGAYEAHYEGKTITFIDTPGHEAFSAMRSRGANVADIALLVVAADEGVKAQTKEAIGQIQASKLPFIVVLNKMDKPEANAERVKQQLSQNGVLVESYGGNVPIAETSASTKAGIPELLELILLVAEMDAPTGASTGPATGAVIESFLDSKRGPAATVVVQTGALQAGDVIATPSVLGKVRILEDYQGAALERAVASQPALVIGFEKGPAVGEEFRVFPDRSEAERFLRTPGKEKAGVPEESEEETLNLILKADVLGSLEALEALIRAIPQETAGIRIVSALVGDVGESDVKLAEGTKATILAFRAKVPSAIAELAERSGVPIISHEVIYEAVQAVERLLEQQVEPQVVREDKGTARILAIFRTEKDKQVLGGTVLEGEIRKGMKTEVYRGEEYLGEAAIENLQHNKEDVSFVPAGEEFGMLLRIPEKLQEQDILKLYTER